MFYFRKELKQQIDCLQRNAKKLLKKQFDFPFEKRVETTDRLPTCKSQKIVEPTVRFPIRKKRTETADRLPAIEGQNIVVTTVRFSIYEKN